VGLIPENELSRRAGVELDPLTGGPIVDQWRETTVPGVFAGGNVLHVHDLVDNCSWEAELAAEGAVRFAKGERTEGREICLRPGRNVRYVVPQRIRGEGPVTLFLRVREMEEGVRVRVGDLWQKRFRVVKPSEQIKVELSPKDLRRLPDGVAEIRVKCEVAG